jgi:tyrosine-protein kinase Etk/Wzc
MTSQRHPLPDPDRDDSRDPASATARAAAADGAGGGVHPGVHPGALRGVAPPARLIEHTAPLPPPDPATLAWRTWLRALAARRWLIAAVTFACTVVALAYALVAPPVYEANMLLHVEEEQPNASKNILNDVSSLFETKKAAIAEMELLRSRLVVAPAIDTLRLYIHARPRYFPLGGEWIAQRQGSRLSAPGWFGRGGYVWGGEKIDVAAFDVPDHLYGREFRVTALGANRWRLGDGQGRALLDGTVGQRARLEVAGGSIELLVTRLRGLPGAQFVLRRTSRLAALERVQRALQISEQGKLSGVIAVTLQGNDPQQVYATLTEIGSEYMRQNLGRRTEEAQKTLAFLDRQLPVAKRQLEEAEASYNGFRSGHETIDLTQEVRIALDTLAAAQARRSTLIQKRAELLGRFTDEHPVLQAVAQQLRETDREIGAQESRIKRLPRIEQEQVRLGRDVKVSTDLYTELLNTAQQLRLMAVGSIGTVRMVDMPVAPENTLKPNRAMIVMLGLVTGLFLGVLLALGWRAARGAIDEPERIEALLGPNTVHASIPHSRSQDRLQRQQRRSRPRSPAGQSLAQPLLLAQAVPADLAAESLRAFRATVQFALTHSRNNVVSCLGPTRGAGASFVSVNLALLLAAGGQRTLLIDADLRDGKLHEYFALDRAAGLADCLAGMLQPYQAVRQGVAPRLDFIAAGGAGPYQAELLQPRLLSDVLRELGTRYDVVLATAPPVLVAADALVVGASAGVVFLVARSGLTTEAHLGAAVKRLNHAGIAPHGVVFNDV